ncbi:MAG: aspartyl/asparaginyl beta-hydroxylase domain-containing protein [bacterium]|nr:aspartyl/asparaginyl beta-hydroxylase domain-containing protein [bacterium]MDZ4286056.1 aspartyl/asparaginyl beta-hydroxylase domain-containing protein [Candidatus Sungbacteria bacterium]
MKNFRLIQKNINVRPFLAELAQNEDYWNTERARIVEVQRETLSISLRSGVSEESKILEDCHGVVNTAIYDLFPFTTSWTKDFAKEIGKLSRMMIVSLQPQGRVYPHIDSGEYYKIRDRYHLALQSKGGSKMISGNEAQIFNTGELWWFNNKEIHEAFNQSAHPRIHMIFDIVPKGNLHLAK